MPSIAKQRRAKRNRVLGKRTQRYTGHAKIKPFNTLCGKLKTNNNLLAKALTVQKQENQLLFSQKIQLSSQLQAMQLACNKRDTALANIHKGAKDMLSMLVKMTNHVTNTIVSCQELSCKSDTSILQPSPTSALRRESTRRLSTKSPTRGIVKPMVSGHTIIKPTISLRRINMQRVNHLLDLSIINEGSPEHISDAAIHTTRPHTAGFTGATRCGYQGERRRRLPERIPVEYVEADDDEGGTRGSQEARLSGRLSNSLTRKRSSENALFTQIQSPSVSLCDVSKLLQNAQTINVRMLQDSYGNGDFNGLLSMRRNPSPHIESGESHSLNVGLQDSQEMDKSLSKTLQTSSALGETGTENDTTLVNITNSNTNLDPLEGPSWLLSGSTVDQTFEDAEMEQTVEIVRRKHVARKLSSSESDSEEENCVDDDSMEFTECVNGQKMLEIPMTESVKKRRRVHSKNKNQFIEDKTNKNIYSNTQNSDDSSSESRNPCKQRHDLLINRSSEFVTDRRQCYEQNNDDDDEDTIMLQLSKAAKNSRFDINEFRLPVVSCSIVASVEPNYSEPEVTTTIQRIPQNHAPPSLLDADAEDGVSNLSSLQLPKLDDAPTTKKVKLSVKKKELRKKVRYYESDSTDSDYALETVKQAAKPTKSTRIKDPSSAKVVLQKLNDTHLKLKSVTPDLSLSDRSHDLDASQQRRFEPGESEQVTDSNSSTYSINESQRPRRQKAPTNLKEPSLEN